MAVCSANVDTECALAGSQTCMKKKERKGNKEEKRKRKGRKQEENKEKK
jgi:hypothetical protein